MSSNLSRTCRTQMSNDLWLQFILLWQPLVTKLIEVQAINLKGGYCCGDHKRTQQGVSSELLPYLYKLQMVCATNN